MKIKELFKNRSIHIYIIIMFAAFILAIVGLLMLRYHVEGETNLPFNIKQITVISTAQGSHSKGEDELWNTVVSQQNYIFFQIEKNSEYRKEEIIKNVTFNNFIITKENELGEVVIYKPSGKNNIYSYSEDTKIDERLEYVGAQFTDTELLEINNQGGLIGFSIMNHNIGSCNFAENEVIPSDGRLLTMANLALEDIAFKISFDIIIETESEKRFKANIVLDLPEADILEEGVSTREETELSNIVFKRF